MGTRYIWIPQCSRMIEGIKPAQLKIAISKIQYDEMLQSRNLTIFIHASPDKTNTELQLELIKDIQDHCATDVKDRVYGDASSANVIVEGIARGQVQAIIGYLLEQAWIDGEVFNEMQKDFNSRDTRGR